MKDFYSYCNRVIGVKNINLINIKKGGKAMIKNNHEKFERYRKICMHQAILQICIVISIFISVTCLYDFIVYKNSVFNFPFIPLSLIFITIIICIFNKIFQLKLNPYYFSLMVAVTVTTGISLMCYINPFAVISSLSTIILLILYFGIFLPFNLKEGILLFSLVWIFFLIPKFFQINSYETETFGKDNLFVLSSIIFSIYWSKKRFRERKKLWVLNAYCKSMKQKCEIKSGNVENQIQQTDKNIAKTERVAFIGQVISSFVHDLNNFLTIILGKSDLVYDSLSEEDKNRQHIETVTKTCRKAATLIKKLLTVSNCQVFMPCKKNLNEIINDVKDMVIHTLSHNIDLIVKEAPKLKLVKVDPLQIEQILLNLCINARDAMPYGGKLILETNNVTLDETYCN